MKRIFLIIVLAILLSFTACRTINPEFTAQPPKSVMDAMRFRDSVDYVTNGSLVHPVVIHTANK